MSGYRDLGTTGQQKISEQLYKQLFGYPDGKLNQSFSDEIPGTSRINVFKNQLFTQDIPEPAPADDDLEEVNNFRLSDNNYTDTVSITKQRSTANTYIVKYTKLVLKSNELTENQTYWFEGANSEFNAGIQSRQVTNNLLNQGIPPNYAPDGSYSPVIYIRNVEDIISKDRSYTIGNAQYPWVYNPNSGIVQFLGDTPYSSGNANNNRPNSNQAT